MRNIPIASQHKRTHLNNKKLLGNKFGQRSISYSHLPGAMDTFLTRDHAFDIYS